MQIPTGLFEPGLKAGDPEAMKRDLRRIPNAETACQARGAPDLLVP